jgi:hypothetical protein
MDIDEPMADLILRHHLTVSVVSSPAYSVIVNRLLDCHHAETPPPDYLSIRLIAKELSEAGLETEAGALLTCSQGVHRSLQTFDLAVNMLSKWLSK